MIPKIFRRIYSLIIKEFLILLRDKKGRTVLIIPPILQLFIFSFAATLEVKNVSLVILNQDSGKHSYEIIQRITAAGTFTNITFTNKHEDIQNYIDEQQAIAAIHFPSEFSKDIESGYSSTIMVIMDGRRSNSAQIVSGYINQIVNSYNEDLYSLQNIKQKIIIDSRNWFNENLIYLWFTVPSLIGTIAMVVALSVTSLSVARERELGTFDQMLVSPLMPYEIMIGKAVPAIIIGILEVLLICFAAIFIFRIPFSGSFLLLMFAMLIFVISVVGVGITISSLSKTQQQAILGSFMFMVPAITLSGYAAPIENMPKWLQITVEANPLKHILIVIKGIFLKDMSFMDVWSNTWPLFFIAFGTLSMAIFIFSRRLE